MYKKKLPLSKDDLSYETVLTRLDTKLYYIFSKAKKEIEERETEWLKLGVFIDWFYKGIYMTSFKSFCFNDDNILHKYICYVEGLADGGNAFKDEDKHRKIRFMIYEHVTYGEDSDDNEEEEEEEEEEEQSRELNEYEQEMLDDYNRQAEFDARQEVLEIEQAEREEQHINENETFKSKCCVLCLDENTTPTILFCSCGHLCLCEKCDKVYAKKECPVCRVKSEIKRKI